MSTCLCSARHACMLDCADIFVQAALEGRPGASYVDIPSNILMGPAQDPVPQPSDSPPAPFAHRLPADSSAVHKAAALLRSAQRSGLYHITLLGWQLPVRTMEHRLLMATFIAVPLSARQIKGWCMALPGSLCNGSSDHEACNTQGCSAAQLCDSSLLLWHTS